MKSFSINTYRIGCGVLFGFFTLLFAIAIPVNAAPQKEAFQYDALPFTLSNIKEHIIPIDMDGDGLKDLLCSNGAVISIYFQDRDGDQRNAFDLTKPDISMELPGTAVGWDVDYAPAEQIDGIHTGKRLVAIVEGKTLMAWSIQNRAVSTPAVLLENLPGFLPKGAYPLSFIRDINEDGLTDIIVPGSGRLHFYFQTESGSYKGNIVINTANHHYSTLTTDNKLGRKVGQRIVIPAMTIRDVNNDGYNDVISKADKITEVFLARGDGGFPSEPSYRIDLASLTSDPEELSLETVDFSNLSTIFTREPKQLLQDLDGDKIEDLLVLDNGKITIYGGTSSGLDLSKPRQILKSGGNVILAFAAVTQDVDKKRSTEDAIMTSGTENRDEAPPKDLIIMRLQDISFRDVIVWTSFSKGLDYDFFIYKNQGKLFEKRPTGKTTLTLKLPSLSKITKHLKSIRNLEQDSSTTKIVRATLSKKQSGKDRLVLSNNTIKGFQIEDDRDEIWFERFDDALLYEPEKLVKVLESLGLILEKDSLHVVDIDNIMKKSSKSGSFKLLSVKDKQPLFSIDVSPYVENMDNEKAVGKQSIAAVDLNGDHLDDMFLFTDRGDTSVSGTLFLSR